jgi:hypothetical protein
MEVDKPPPVVSDSGVGALEGDAGERERAP